MLLSMHHCVPFHGFGQIKGTGFPVHKSKEPNMVLVNEFNLSSMTMSELQTLYLKLFNQLANMNSSFLERLLIQTQLITVRNQMNLRL